LGHFLSATFYPAPVDSSDRLNSICCVQPVTSKIVKQVLNRNRMPWRHREFPNDVRTCCQISTLKKCRLILRQKFPAAPVPIRRSNYKNVQKFTASGCILDGERTLAGREGKKTRRNWNWCQIGDISKTTFGCTWRANGQMAVSAPSARNETKQPQLGPHKTAAIDERCDTLREATVNCFSTTAQSLTAFHWCSLFTYVPRPACRAFAKLRRATINFVISVCLSVCVSVYPHAITKFPL
jgi:hypothetical protein